MSQQTSTETDQIVDVILADPEYVRGLLTSLV